MEVAGILLNYKTREDVIRVAKSLKEYDIIQPIVIDNDSDAQLYSWCLEEGVRYEDTGENLGYTGGNNIGLRIAVEEGYTYGFILNPDIELQSLDLNGMVEVLDRKSSDILFPLVFDEKGEMQNELPTIENRVLRMTGELPSLPPATNNRLWYVDHGPGSAMMIRLDILDEIGYLREEFFMYTEEVEFCYRARRAGYRVAIYPKSEVLHTRSEDIWMSDFKMYYNTRNRFLLNRYLFDHSFIYATIIFVYIINCMVLILVDRNWNLIEPLILGIIDGIRLKTGHLRY